MFLTGSWCLRGDTVSILDGNSFSRVKFQECLERERKVVISFVIFDYLVDCVALREKWNLLDDYSVMKATASAYVTFENSDRLRATSHV